MKKLEIKNEKGEVKPTVVAAGLSVILLGTSQLLTMADKELAKLAPERTELKAYEFVMPDVSSFSLVEAVGKQASGDKLPPQFVSKLFLPEAPKPKVIQPTRPKPKPQPVVKPKPEPKPKPPKSDYRNFVKDRVNISGVTNTGIFINGRFYQAGDRLDLHYKHEAKGRVESPVIQSVTKSSVVFDVSGHVLTVPLES